MSNGRAWLVLLALVAAAGLVLLWALAGGSGERSEGELRPEAGQHRTTAPAGEPLATEPDPVAERHGQPAPEEPSAGDLALGELERAEAGAAEDRFRGRGRLRGHVEVEGDHPFPEVWRLVIAPSDYLVGRERAEARVVDLTGTQDFDVQDLPLGGYDVRAEAAGWNGLTLPVLLEARSPSVYCNLRMVKAGSVDGRVLDHEGRPAEGVTVTLTALPERTVREATTDALGLWRFEDVVDGAYELGVGPFESPILEERRTLRVAAPGMTLPDLELPPLATLSLVLFDGTDERLLPGVTVYGSGTEGGAFEGVTDGWGELVVRHLPPGHWRLRFHLEGYQERRDQLDLVGGETREAAIALGR